MLPLIAGAIEAAPAIGAAAMKWGPALLGAIPLVQDLLKGGADPEKIAKVKQMRDDRIEQLIGSDPSNNRNKATAQANDEFKQMMDQVENEGKAGAGEIAMDVASLAGDVALGHFAAKGMGKKVNSNAPAAGGPTTATEGVNGKLSAVAPAPSPVKATPDVETGPTPEAKIHDAELLPESGFTFGQAPRIGMDGVTGGMSPRDMADLQASMMKAKMMQRARMNPGMSGVPIEMGMGERPMLGIGKDMTVENNIANWAPPSDIPSPTNRKARINKQQQMNDMFVMRDAGM